MHISLGYLIFVVVVVALGIWANQQLTPDGFLKKLIYVLLVIFGVLGVLAAFGIVGFPAVSIGR